MNKVLLQINSVVNSGSTGRISEQIGEAAINNNWRSYIAYGRFAQKSSSELVKIGGVINVLGHGFESILYDFHGLSSRNGTKKLIGFIENLKPDIIHLHNLHGYYINYKILFNYLKNSNIPVVWTLHDCWAFTGHCSYFDFAGCNKWQELCFKCPQVNKYPVSIYDGSERNYKLKREIFTSYENVTLVSVSNWLDTLLSKSFLKGLNRMVIHNGVDLKVFNEVFPSDLKKKIGLEGKFLILGVASIWSQRKGLEDFIELSRLISLECVIVLVGLSKKQSKDLPKNIVSISKTESTDQLAQFYSISDVFVNPTYEDNFPTTNIEALACGTPVITYSTGGSPEAIDNKTGIVVEKGNIIALKNAIENIKINGKIAYSKACRERAVNFYDRNKVYQKYLDLYNHILIRD